MNNEDKKNHNHEEPQKKEVLYLPKFENKPTPNLIIKNEFRKEDLLKLRYIVYPILFILAGISFLVGSYLYSLNAKAKKERAENQMQEMRQELFTSFSCNLNSETYKDDSLLRVMREDRPPLKASYSADDLIAVSNIYTKNGQRMFFREIIREDFEEMMQAARAAGHFIELNSAYRSFSLQADWFESSNAKGIHDLTAVPGTSEHQLGTAVDISSSQGNLATEAGYVWLLNNAYKYGFNLTYPFGREEETGFGYEPWHWRYIGRDLATQYKESGKLFNFGDDLFLESNGAIYPHSFFGEYIGIYLYKDEDTNKIILDNRIKEVYPLEAMYVDFRENISNGELIVKSSIDIRGIDVNLYAEYIESLESYIIFIYEEVGGVSYSDSEIQNTL